MLNFPSPTQLHADLNREGVRVDGEVRAALERYTLALGRMAYLRMDNISQRMCDPDQRCSIPDNDLENTAALAMAYIRDVLALQPRRGMP